MEDKIAAEVAEWSSDANEAIEISILAGGSSEPTERANFHPRFTYPIFGDEESIFGYKDLRIKLRFTSSNLVPHCEFSYSDKFRPIGDVKATDLRAKLADFLPKGAFGSLEEYERTLAEDASTFKPPGKIVEAYSRNGRNYEIWCCELTNPDAKDLLRRFQIMTSFFIEGGVPLDVDEEEWSMARWRVFFIYEKLPETTSQESPYAICGYANSYRFVTYSPTSYKNTSGNNFEPSSDLIPIQDLPNRSRISQFVILPHCQGQGCGRRLYNAMVDVFLTDPACIEITVEDPNEAFDDLRDYCDFERFARNGTFSQLRINTSIDPKLVMKRTGTRVPTEHLIDRPLFEKLRVRNKVAPRQWGRLVDLWFLSQVPKYSRDGGLSRLTQRAKASDPGDKALYLWRLLVKQRIYRQNKDVMAQFDRPERIEKLEQTLEGQVADYERLLERIQQAQREHEENGGPAPVRNKRRVIEDDEDSVAGSEPKRARTEEPLEAEA